MEHTALTWVLSDCLILEEPKKDVGSTATASTLSFFAEAVIDMFALVLDRIPSFPCCSRGSAGRFCETDVSSDAESSTVLFLV